MLEVVVHRVDQPGHGRAERLSRLDNVQQSLFKIDRADIAVAATLGMSERFIDEENLDAFVREIAMYRLQTGDVSDERRSGEAAEDEHRVAASQAAQ